MKKQNRNKERKNAASEIATPTPPQVMDPSKQSGKENGGKKQKKDKDRELAPNEEL